MPGTAAVTTKMPPGTAAGNTRPSSVRLASIDILRGLVMIVMALDHARDFFSAALFDPTDLTRTTFPLFFTRWITHFCAPVFVLLAGTGSFLSIASGSKDRCELPAFLVKRGLWLIFLEIAVISPLGWSFNFDFSFTRLQVIWVIGASMIVLAGLILIYPPRVIAAIGLIIIAAHNVFDASHLQWLGNSAWAWSDIHNVTFFHPFPRVLVASLYPLIPWVGVMALGYGTGPLALIEPQRRKRILFTIGPLLLTLFVALRFTNIYGDPKPWSVQSNWPKTLMSFVNCTKYPPSLLYLLLTLGVALCFLAYADRLPQAVKAPLAVFGRVPLFYYLLHLPLLHGLAVAFSFVTYGRADWLYQDSFAAKTSAHPLPAGYGYGLPVVYLVWALVVISLYPLCKWFAGVKRRSRNALLSYL